MRRMKKKRTNNGEKIERNKKKECEDDSRKGENTRKKRSWKKE